MKFRKKPVVIDAVKFTGTNQMEIAAFANGGEQPSKFEIDPERGLSIETLEGVMHVSPGDWVIRGVKGEYYPCKPDIFRASYDLVGDNGLAEAVPE